MPGDVFAVRPNHRIEITREPGFVLPGGEEFSHRRGLRSGHRARQRKPLRRSRGEERTKQVEARIKRKERKISMGKILEAWGVVGDGEASLIALATVSRAARRIGPRG